MKIIGISGTNGSGKDTVGQLLAEQHGWLFVSVTDILRDELKRRGLPVEREHMRELSAEWRRQYGYAVLIDKAFEIYESHEGEFKGLVISSLRNPSEADEVHKLGGKVVWVDANPQVRYERITSRVRGDEDRKSYEEFLAEEEAEMHHSGDDATLNMAGVKAKADIFLENNGSDMAVFKKNVEEALYS